MSLIFWLTFSCLKKIAKNVRKNPSETLVPYELGTNILENVYLHLCVTCHVSHVKCHVSHFTGHIFFYEKVADIVGGGSVINRA